MVLVGGADDGSVSVSGVPLSLWLSPCKNWDYICSWLVICYKFFDRFEVYNTVGHAIKLWVRPTLEAGYKSNPEIFMLVSKLPRLNPINGKFHLETFTNSNVHHRWNFCLQKTKKQFSCMSSHHIVLVGKQEQGMKTFSQNTLVPLITYFSDGWEADKEFLLHQLF